MPIFAIIKNYPNSNNNMSNSLENAFPSYLLNDIATLKRYLNVDDRAPYRLAILDQDILKIPYRIYNKPLSITKINSRPYNQQLMLSCIFTRHHNGFIRHDMVKNIIQIHPILKEDDFVIPYIFLLLGEYIVEISIELYSYIQINKKVFTQFIDENKALSLLTYQRAASYWNEYYRKTKYVHFHEYPVKIIFDLFEKTHQSNR